MRVLSEPICGLDFIMILICFYNFLYLFDGSKNAVWVLFFEFQKTKKQQNQKTKKQYIFFQKRNLAKGE